MIVPSILTSLVLGRKGVEKEFRRMKMGACRGEGGGPAVFYCLLPGIMVKY